MRRLRDGEGYLITDNRCSGGTLDEAGMLDCVHCSAAIYRRDIEKPKTGLSLHAKCVPCNGYLCPECGLATSQHGHSNAEHWRTWPHHMWIQRSLDEIYRREQNAKLGG